VLRHELFAAFARKQASWQRRPAGGGTLNDVTTVATVMPACDAIYVDNEIAMEASFQPNLCRRIGVVPRGDQVRRTGGISETADSSKKTIQADSAHAPF
jgi:hypothetical protein